MALRARLTPPPTIQQQWPWHTATYGSVPLSALTDGERRMEAEAYLAGGYRIRLNIEREKHGWTRLGKLARVWQPSRLKGIRVDAKNGTPFLAATQVFDLRPTPRKWLALEKTSEATDRFVQQGTILVTCSGSVGLAILARASLQGIFISHDILRCDSIRPEDRGWIYAFLRSHHAIEMMTSTRYGHMIKHLECAHLEALPIPEVTDRERDSFNEAVRSIIAKRDEGDSLLAEAEALFSEAVGVPMAGQTKGKEIGFSISSSSMSQGRRRLEGSFYDPNARAVLAAFRAKGLTTERLDEVAERVWWMTRFKRVLGDNGAPYLSAEELFSVNPPITKRVLVEQTDNAEEFFVKAGWIVMARSGQVYGLNGSVALMTKHHEASFLSDDLIRIIPNTAKIRAGYLYTALGHPTLGRPIVIRNGYGTSIPHLDPADISAVPIARLGKAQEDAIADRAEASAQARAEADVLERRIADDAAAIVDRFLANAGNVRRMGADAEIGAKAAKIIREYLEQTPEITGAFMRRDGTYFVLTGAAWTEELAALPSLIFGQLQEALSPDWRILFRGSYFEKYDPDPDLVRIWPCP